jgi:L-ribulokinase
VPADYVDVLRNAVPAALRDAGADPADVVGIATDFTACTMVPTLLDGTPLNETPQFADRPHAYVKLWKHHAAQPQADRINALAASRGELVAAPVRRAHLVRVGVRQGAAGAGGGPPRSTRRSNAGSRRPDWIVWQLTGTYVRNACSAGYKGIRQDGRYPDPDFLAALNPAFADFVTAKLEAPIGQLGARGRRPERAGPRRGPGCRRASPWPSATSTPRDRGGGQRPRTRPAGGHHGHLDVPRHERHRPAHGAGMCGVVDGGIVAGAWGYEAGQSGVGDIFAHFADTHVHRPMWTRAPPASRCTST